MDIHAGWEEFKRCSPMAVIQQLGVEHLTIVGKAGFFRDGTEFFNEIDSRDWLANDDSETHKVEEYFKRMERDSDDDEDEGEEEDDDDDDGLHEQLGRLQEVIWQSEDALVNILGS